MKQCCVFLIQLTDLIILKSFPLVLHYSNISLSSINRFRSWIFSMNFCSFSARSSLKKKVQSSVFLTNFCAPEGVKIWWFQQFFVSL